MSNPATLLASVQLSAKFFSVIDLCLSSSLPLFVFLSFLPFLFSVPLVYDYKFLFPFPYEELQYLWYKIILFSLVIYKHTHKQKPRERLSPRGICNYSNLDNFLVVSEIREKCKIDTLALWHFFASWKHKDPLGRL